MEKKNNKLSLITNGFLKENPVLKLVLGTCPTLAVTSSAFNGFGMGVAATFVLICSNVVISALRKIIPDKVRIPAFITVIAGFVTIVQMLVKAFLPALDTALGVFLPLIVVNCIILGRAEAFASKNTVIDSALDGVGMGLGFTVTLTLMGIFRELLGAGTVFGFIVTKNLWQPIGFFTSAAGGFFTFGLFMALAVKLEIATMPKEGCGAGCIGCKMACANAKSEGGNA
ncbi:MAG: electron transport complex subunit E [Ruminococcaceae bacterium]|nr:electron transport complex subunit E [Oscillospiraceae bacterium]